MTETGICRLWHALVLWLALLLGGLTLPAAADLRIDITRGMVEPMPIAILPFPTAGGEQSRVGADIARVISSDLGGSGVFRPIEQAAFIEPSVAIDALPKFADWRSINAQALVNGQAGPMPDGRLKVDFRLWDVFAGQQLEGLGYQTQPSNWRRIAHIIAAAIYKRITGEDGYFDSRVAYVAETGPQNQRTKRLAIMDQDGANQRYLTDGSTLVLTPRFSPSQQEITYIDYSTGVPRVYIRQIDSGRQETVGDFPGMTFAPRFSPEGDRLILSMAKDGNTDIFTVDLRNRAVRRLTNNASIDTSPSYSPDGRQVVFNSDRGGSQQIYVMDGDGGGVRRISHGQGKYFSPVWSPRGDLIAITKIVGGRFQIGVMTPDGGSERVLAEGYNVEGPTWAPNGRVLMFFRKDPSDAGGGGGRSRLYVVDVNGGNEREVPTPTDASDPSWSPLNP